MPKHGDLKIFHIPQVPCPTFEVSVQTLIEAKLVEHTLALYDLFQYEHRIKPDYSNANGLVVFDSTYDGDGEHPEGGWIDWCDEFGRDFDEYSLEDLRKTAAEGKLPRWEGEA